MVKTEDIKIVIDDQLEGNNLSPGADIIAKSPPKNVQANTAGVQSRVVDKNQK